LDARQLLGPSLGERHVSLKSTAMYRLCKSALGIAIDRIARDTMFSLERIGLKAERDIRKHRAIKCDYKLSNVNQG